MSKKAPSGLFTTLSVVFFLGGFYLVSSSILASTAWYVRFFVILLTLALSIFCLALTEHKNYLIGLFKGARIEMRKVYWPKKDELTKTTLMVLATVAAFAIFLTIVDAILSLIVKWVIS